MEVVGSLECMSNWEWNKNEVVKGENDEKIKFDWKLSKQNDKQCSKEETRGWANDNKYFSK